ncbi:MAG: tetratricopeptide repeat protein, partial [Burkholderiaceae bacterium]|nr:tetratricopeptide repeat protein [Burkholderiaceae bacterium]
QVGKVQPGLELIVQQGLPQTGDAVIRLAELSGFHHCAEKLWAMSVSIALMTFELADACVAIGSFADALHVIDETFEIGVAIGDHHVEAELHRIRGELLLVAGKANEAPAAACFKQALAIARQQGQKSSNYVLRPVWRGCGKRRAGRLGAQDCWATSSAGSPKGSICPICGMQNGCWIRCEDIFEWVCDKIP